MLIDGKEVQRWQLTNEQVGAREFSLPISALKSETHLDVALYFPDARSPAELGISDDKRVLAMNVKSIEIYGR